MDISELATELTELGIDPRAYSLEGGHENDTYCVDTFGAGRWRVYYTERGREFNEKIFYSEDEACRYLLGRLSSSPSVYLNRPPESTKFPRPR